MQIEIPEYVQHIFHEKKHRYCLLIPLFNEGSRFLCQLKKMRNLKIMNMVDVIICDAGSTDGCTDHDILAEAGITTLLVRKGKGRQGTDLRMGYHWAIQKEYLGFITVDGNDKDDTSAISLFIQKLDEGYDYVQGSRYIHEGKAIRTPLVRHVALKLINEPIMSLCAGKHLTDTTNGFKGYSYNFLMDPRVQPFRNIFYGYELSYYLPVRACRLGFRFIEVPVTRSYPESGEVPSKIGGLKGNIYQLSILFNIIIKQYNP